MSSTRDLDLVVVGATGFTGRQCADYLAQHAPESLRWGLAGRSEGKLLAVRDALGPAHADRPVVVVDTLDGDAVDALAARSRVVLTTVGPYARFGSLLFAACARHGADYLDITGETPWVREMIDAHHETARRTGARMVPLSGFDSIPSDLGVWMVADHARRHLDQGLVDVTSVFKAKGGFNGGTAASALGMMDREAIRRLAHPFLLSPDPKAVSDDVAARSQDPRGPRYEPRLDAWLAPFFMGPINSRVVRRSAALLAARGQGYGDGFAYREWMWGGRGLAGRATALAATATIGTVFGLGQKPWGRRLFERVVPDPGEGPSEAEMDGGFFRCDLLARTEGGVALRGRIHGDGDPGNRCTVRMLCESALAFATQGDALPAQEGGVWTPASALGGVLLERLRAAGMQWEVAAAD
ncbi:MAG: saccharopine dehydrogenase NADP-binding domain-containing protein [Alphaproteobacteria bacterium]|nr:saccharopine dehydrogenase NADP-binding domain-containing protein [Alphaproteobacteria bacterium]